jgi:Xaa-Pro aminopeptidase
MKRGSVDSKADTLMIFKNEVITVEPGVYFEGKFGMRVERMVVVE